jgi:assimilatory nitrate reductase catalytic subunit
MSRTGTVASLFAHDPEPRLSMHPRDLQVRGIGEGELAKVASRRGHVFLKAGADPDLPPGTAYIPMHWGARFLGGEGRRGINELTLAALDPSSKQPELKHCAVQVAPAELPWRLMAFGYARDTAALLNSLDWAMSCAPYAARTLIGRDRAGVRLSLAAREPLGDDLLQRIDAAFGLESLHTVRDRELSRRMAYDGEELRAARLCGDARVDRLAGELLPRGRTVCNCFDVAESEIDAFLVRSASLEALQATLKCGTNCGSCLPELRRKLLA